MTKDLAALVTAAAWEPRRAEMINWMIKRKGFSKKGADRAAQVFIDTMVFVAKETGEPQLGSSRVPEGDFPCAG